MLSRSFISVGLALLLAFALTVPALAGGWAVITLDELPTNVVAGEPLTIGFMVRQHGVTPLDGLFPTITARSSSEEPLIFHAEPAGETGHYTATLTFPEEGSWEWSIQAFTMDQRMPMLSVAAPGTATAKQPVARAEAATAPLSPIAAVRLLALGIGLAGLILAYQRQSRLALGLTVLAVSLGLASFLVGSSVPAAEAQSKDSPTISIDSSPSQVELGRQLFLAKGCITCHYNERAASRSDYWTIEMGAPNLTDYSAHPEVLFIRLKDPVAAKSDAKMPNLGLKEAEIEALIAFINSK